MMDKILTSVAEGLEDYLGIYFEEPAGFAKVGNPYREEEGEEEDKMVISLLNIEREGAMGATKSFQAEGKEFVQKMSPWYLNIYFVVVARFREKRYLDGVKMLSAAIAYLQQHPTVSIQGNRKFVVEPVTLSIQELTNVWSILGGKYYPSVVCKVRMLKFQGDEIQKMTGSIRG